MQTTVKGVKGSAILGTPVLVCTSEVYIINTVLPPALTVAEVPSVLGTAGQLCHAALHLILQIFLLGSSRPHSAMHLFEPTFSTISVF